MRLVSTLIILLPAGASKVIDKNSYWSKPLDGAFSSSSPLAPERTNILPNPADRKKEAVTTTLVGQEEHQPSAGGNEEQVAVKRTGGSLFSASSSSSSFSTSLHHIDAILDKHQGNLSTEIQLILQRESIHLSLPQSPHSTSRGDGAQCAPPPCKLVSQFSQYVSFYNPRPPVHEYVSSLQVGIDSLLTELHDCWPSRAQPCDLYDPAKPSDPSGSPDTENALASTVDAFVSSIRESRDGEASRSPSTQTSGQWRPHPPDDGSPAPPSQPASTRDHTAEPNPHDRFNAMDGTPRGPASSPPPTTALSSLISQIQPEVFSKLVEIVQDVKKNSVQFYVHATEPGDSVYEEIKVTAQAPFHSPPQFGYKN